MTISDEKINIALAPSTLPSSEGQSEANQLMQTDALVPASAHEEVDQDTLNKIRDLLFGQQVQRQEQRLQQLEQRLDRECTDIRDHINQRLQSLEMSIRNDLQSLTQVLQTNHDSQTTAVSDLNEKYQAGMSAVEAQLGELGTQVERNQADIIATLEEKIGSLGTDFSEKHAELKALLEREVRALNTVDANDRANLANLFSELAQNIRINP